MPLPRVLIINDEAGNGLSPPFPARLPYHLHTAATLAEGLAAFDAFHPEIVVFDLNSPNGPGMETFRAVRARGPRCPVLLLTAHGSTEMALEAMKEGAFDYLAKPVDPLHLAELMDRAVETARTPSTSTFPPGQSEEHRIIGHSEPIQEMCKLIGLLAPRDINVLILGECGTGKELAARALHRHSRRAEQPFTAVNCAGLTEQLLESELFGHEPGAFPGAAQQRIGKLEQCRAGTLFLDEIGDMSLAVQAKLLRVLQEQCFERLGGNESVPTRARLLAATNQDLDRLVAEGRFRADLYYRLKSATVRVPSLRERGDDVMELAQQFLLAGNAGLGLHLCGFGPKVLACLRRYPWPGNVRELQSVVREAMLRTRGPRVLIEYLPECIRRAAFAPAEECKGAVPCPDADLKRLIAQLRKDGGADLYARVLRVVDRVVLTEVLGQTRGNQARASDIMGIDRKTLRQKLRNLGLQAFSKLAPSASEGIEGASALALGAGEGW